MSGKTQFVLHKCMGSSDESSECMGPSDARRDCIEASHRRCGATCSASHASATTLRAPNLEPCAATSSPVLLQFNRALYIQHRPRSSITIVVQRLPVNRGMLSCSLQTRSHLHTGTSLWHSRPSTVLASRTSGDLEALVVLRPSNLDHRRGSSTS